METAKHFGSKLRKTLVALLATMALMAVLLPGALAVDLNVDVGFYFKQSRGGTCTLASAAMTPTMVKVVPPTFSVWPTAAPP